MRQKRVLLHVTSFIIDSRSYGVLDFIGTLPIMNYWNAIEMVSYMYTQAACYVEYGWPIVVVSRPHIAVQASYCTPGNFYQKTVKSCCCHTQFLTYPEKVIAYHTILNCLF